MYAVGNALLGGGWRSSMEGGLRAYQAVANMTTNANMTMTGAHDNFVACAGAAQHDAAGLPEVFKCGAAWAEAHRNASEALGRRGGPPSVDTPEGAGVCAFVEAALRWVALAPTIFLLVVLAARSAAAARRRRDKAHGGWRRLRSMGFTAAGQHTLLRAANASAGAGLAGAPTPTVEQVPHGARRSHRAHRSGGGAKLRPATGQRDAAALLARRAATADAPPLTDLRQAAVRLQSDLPRVVNAAICPE
jgi:hypothetical protein